MNRLEASITGSIWKILVNVDDLVEAGDTLIIMESMKMEIPIEAEFKGRVAQILVKEGDHVDEGQELIKLA